MASTPSLNASRRPTLIPAPPVIGVRPASSLTLGRSVPSSAVTSPPYGPTSIGL